MIVISSDRVRVARKFFEPETCWTLDGYLEYLDSVLSSLHLLSSGEIEYLIIR